MNKDTAYCPVCRQHKKRECFAKIDAKAQNNQCNVCREKFEKKKAFMEKKGLHEDAKVQQNKNSEERAKRGLIAILKKCGEI